MSRFTFGPRSTTADTTVSEALSPRATISPAADVTNALPQNEMVRSSRSGDGSRPTRFATTNGSPLAIKATRGLREKGARRARLQVRRAPPPKAAGSMGNLFAAAAGL